MGQNKSYLKYVQNENYSSILRAIDGFRFQLIIVALMKAWCVIGDA